MKEVLELVIKVSENIVEVGGRIKEQVEEIQKVAEQAANSIEGLASRLRTAGKIFLGFGAGLLGTYTALAVAGSRYADTLNKEAKQLGVSAEKWAVLKAAMEDAEVDTTRITPLIARMSHSITVAQAKAAEEAEKAAAQQRKAMTRLAEVEARVAAEVQRINYQKQQLFTQLQRGKISIAEYNMKLAELDARYSKTMASLAAAQQKFAEVASKAASSFQSDIVDPMVEGIQRLGINLQQFKDPVELFIAVINRLREVKDPILQLALAQQIFGRNAVDIVPILRISREEWEQTVETYRKTGVALKENVIKRIDELNDGIKRAMDGIKALGARLHAAASEHLQPFIDKANEFIGKLNEFFDKHPQLAGLIGLIWLLGGVISSILGSLLAFGANIAIIAGNWTALKNILLKIFGVFAIFKKVFDWVKLRVLGLGGVFGFLSRIFGWVRTGAMLLVGALGKLAAALGWPIWAVIVLIAVIGFLIYALIRFRKEIWEFVKKGAKWFWEGLKKIAGYIQDFLKWVWEQIKKLPHILWEGLKEAISAAYEWGKNLVQRFWEGIKSLANKPVEAFKWIVQKIRNLLPFSPPKEGALRDLPTSVKKFGIMLAQGIAAEKGRVQKAASSLVEAMNVTKALEEQTFPQVGRAVMAAMPSPATVPTVRATSAGGYTYTVTFTLSKDMPEQIQKHIATFIEAHLVPYLRRVF